MTDRPLVVVVSCLLLLLPVNLHAGFSDLLKSATEALSTSSLTDTDIVQGLKQALEVGTENAVAGAGRPGGYLNDPEIKIPLPGAVEKIEPLLRTAGYGNTVDNFEISMNRAAERAAPEAKSIFYDALRNMTISDARRILNGRENEATLYFKDKTSSRLADLFKPVVHDAMGEVGATRSYQDLEASVRAVPFAGKLAFDLDQYVTDRALDGLFHLLAAEEAKIRTNPAARTTDLLKKVFAGK